MIEIIEKKYCTGCEACLNVCPHAAIMMVRDHEGFDYPSIYSDKCVDCGLCVKVCPVLHYEDIADKRKIYNDVQKAIAAKTNCEEWRRVTSSVSSHGASSSHKRHPLDEWTITDDNPLSSSS